MTVEANMQTMIGDAVGMWNHFRQNGYIASYSGTDLATSNGTNATPTITSASHLFKIDDVGLFVRVTAGTNWTVGYYRINSVNSSGGAVVDRAVGSAASLSSGTYSVTTRCFIPDQLTFLGANICQSYAPQALAAIAGMRGNIDAAARSLAAVFTPLLQEYALQVSGLTAPESDPQSIITRLNNWFVAQSLSVQSRQFTFGSPAAGGGNVGTGVINRLNVDQDNFNLENQFADAKTCICISDQYTGAVVQEEVFQVRGAPATVDLIATAGSGAIGQLRALSGRDSARLIQNPSFDTFTGSVGAVTAFTGWTPTTLISNFDANTSTYRTYQGAPSPAYSLKIKASDTLTQAFTVNNAQLDPNKPYYLQIAYNRQTGSGDGTLTLTIGSQTVSVVLGAQTGWNILRIAIGQKNWVKTFNSSTAGISIALSGWSTGYVLVDDIIFAQYQPFDGSWYAPVGGVTSFLLNDTFTWTDTEVGAIIQRAFWYAFGRSLPSVTSSPTWAEPS